jgi:hypothetical protein
MAQVHVLEYVNGHFRCIIHTATPTGNNGAGIAWSLLFLQTGRSGRTVMVEGTAPGQITSAEKAEIMAGTVLEFELAIDADPAMTGGQFQTLLQAQAPGLITAQIAQWEQELRLYGATRP